MLPVESPFRTPEFVKWLRCSLYLRRLRKSSLAIVAEANREDERPDDSRFFRMGWRFGASAGDLPAWYEPHRVQGSTQLRINSSFQSHPPDPHAPPDFKVEFKQAAIAFNELGAKIYMRHVKSSDEDPWWPTAQPARVPPRHPDEPLDLIHAHQESDQCEHFFTIPIRYADVIRDIIIADLEAVTPEAPEDMSLIGYYRHMAECRIAREHTDWICKKPSCSGPTDPDWHHWIPEAEDEKNRLGFHLDISTPGYREIVKTRLLELAERGVKGFNFDYRHMPPHGSWGTELERAFLATTGRTAPRIVSEDDPTFLDALSDPIYRQYLDFQAYKVEETFAYWRDQVKARFPDVIFSISTTTLPCLSNRRMTTNLARIADGAKNEWDLAINRSLNFPMEVHHGAGTYFDSHGLLEPEDDIRMALGWTLLRDAADGRPPRIWAPNFPDARHTFAFAAALITYGAIANMAVDESVIHDILTGETTTPAYATPRDGLEAAFALGNQVEGYIKQTKPLKWAAVHFSELARNQRPPDLVQAWQEVLWPVTGAFGVFVREGLPVGVINDYQLERDQLEDYQLLFLPTLADLTRQQKRSIARFVDRGGILMKNNPSWLWGDPVGNKAATQALTAEVRTLVGCMPAPIQVIGGPEKMHAVAFKHTRDPRLIVGLTNDFSWIQTQTMNNLVTYPNRPPDPIADATVLVNGRGRPARVLEVLSGRLLTPSATSTGYQIRLPKFDTLAFLVLEF